MKLETRTYSNSQIRDGFTQLSFEKVTAYVAAWHVMAANVQQVINHSTFNIKQSLLELSFLQDLKSLDDEISYSEDMYMVQGARFCKENTVALLASIADAGSVAAADVNPGNLIDKVNQSLSDISEILRRVSDFQVDLSQIMPEAFSEQIATEQERFVYASRTLMQISELAALDVFKSDTLGIISDFTMCWGSVHHAITSALDSLKDEAAQFSQDDDLQLRKLRAANTVAFLNTYDVIDEAEHLIRLPHKAQTDTSANLHSSHYVTLNSLEHETMKLICLFEGRRNSQEQLNDFEQAARLLASKSKISDILDIIAGISELGLVDEQDLHPLQMILHYYFPEQDLETVQEEIGTDEQADAEDQLQLPAPVSELDTAEQNNLSDLGDSALPQNTQIQQTAEEAVIEPEQGGVAADSAESKLALLKIPDQDKARIAEYWHQAQSLQHNGNLEKFNRKMGLCCQRLASIYTNSTESEYAEMLELLLNTRQQLNELSTSYKKLGKVQHKEMQRPAAESDPYLQSIRQRLPAAKKWLNENGQNAGLFLALIEKCASDGRPARGGALLIPIQYLIRKSKGSVEGRLQGKLHDAIEYGKKHGLFISPRQEVISLAMPNDVKHPSLRILYLYVNRMKFKDAKEYSID